MLQLQGLQQQARPQKTRTTDTAVTCTTSFLQLALLQQIKRALPQRAHLQQIQQVLLRGDFYSR
jgi:hypothetical protein